MSCLILLPGTSLTGWRHSLLPPQDTNTAGEARLRKWPITFGPGLPTGMPMPLISNLCWRNTSGGCSCEAGRLPTLGRPWSNHHDFHSNRTVRQSHWTTLLEKLKHWKREIRGVKHSPCPGCGQWRPPGCAGRPDQPRVNARAPEAPAALGCFRLMVSSSVRASPAAAACSHTCFPTCNGTPLQARCLRLSGHRQARPRGRGNPLGVLGLLGPTLSTHVIILRTNVSKLYDFSERYFHVLSGIPLIFLVKVSSYMFSDVCVSSELHIPVICHLKHLYFNL